MAASDVDICNRGLQKIGAARITSLTEDSPAARDCNASYDILRRAELRGHVWSFSVKRAQLAALTDAPEFQFANAYQMPSDCLRILGDDDQDTQKDWRIEGRTIVTDDDSPLYIRYVADVTDTGQFDALFVEALASKIGYELCEKITQSSSKKESVFRDYTLAIREAKRVNAIEKRSDEPPEDDWVLARY
jgi:hypothetical protein